MKNPILNNSSNTGNINKGASIQEEESIRSAPCNTSAEQMILGAILVNNNILNYIIDFLKAEHFYEPIHQKIFSSIIKIIEKGFSASPVTLKASFDGDSDLAEHGGGNYLYKLASLATTVIDAKEYARIIYEQALKRELITIGADIVNEAYDKCSELSATEQLEKAEAELYKVSAMQTTDQGFLHIKDAVAKSIGAINKAIENPGALVGISTGFTDLDHQLAGFHNSDLVIIAGRPSMGKTAFAINLAVNSCDFLKSKGENKSVGFFSLEMSADQIATRIMSMKSCINSKKLISGQIDKEEEHDRIYKAAIEIKEMPFFIDDTPALSISAIRARARLLKRKHNLGILFIDYLQLLHGVGRTESRVLEITEITQGLKAIAKELDIPVIALAQLSRAVEQRENKKPLLSDLRESGSIEQDADVVMFIYREEYYMLGKQPDPSGDKYSMWLEELNKVKNQAEIIVAKHRKGPVGTVRLYNNTEISKFLNFAQR